jgi:hypothetical protein
MESVYETLSIGSFTIFKVKENLRRRESLLSGAARIVSRTDTVANIFASVSQNTQQLLIKFTRFLWHNGREKKIELWN